MAPAAQVKILTAPPVIGAALLGLDLLEAGTAAHARARRTLTHERFSRKTHTRRKD